MQTRRTVALASLALLAAPAFARAQAAAPSFARYDKASFDRALAAGETLVVHVHADWCPTCRAQLSAFSSIGAAGFRNARLIRVDFDQDKAFLQQFNVRMQSTLLVFKGGREVGRLVGQTSRDAIAQTLTAI